MKVLKDILQAVASYSMHSPFVTDVVKTWASSNWVILYDWIHVVSVVLEDGPQLQ